MSVTASAQHITARRNLMPAQFRADGGGPSVKGWLAYAAAASLGSYALTAASRLAPPPDVCSA
jgi:hypothetical protein